MFSLPASVQLENDPAVGNMRGILAGVIDHVEYNLFNLGGIGVNHTFATGFDLQQQFHFGLLHALQQAIVKTIKQLADGDLFISISLFSLFQTCELQDVFDQVGQPIRLCLERVGIAGLFFRRYHFFRHHLGVHAKGGERRTQFMGDRGNKRGTSLAQFHDSIQQQSGSQRGQAQPAPGDDQRPLQARDTIE